MTLFAALFAFVDGLDPRIGTLLDYFSDEHVPLRLSLAIIAVAVILLATLSVWGSTALWRIRRARRALRRIASAREFAAGFTAVDRTLSQSIFAPAWTDYRDSLRLDGDRVLYPQRPEEYFGLHALRSGGYPARLFAAAHGYFVGVGLLLTFVGLVAALKFAAAGVASSDLTVAKEALKALLSAASFKFMTSIAGLGCSLVLSVAARLMAYLIEEQAQDFARDLERKMVPIFTESVAYDQLTATREQLVHLREIGTTLAQSAAAASRPPAPAQTIATAGIDTSALQQILATFAAELRGSTGSEMKQLAGRLAEVGDAIGGMRHHIDNSGQVFADQLNLAASSLLNASITLQESVDSRVDRVGNRIDALAEIFAKSEAMFAASAQKAAQGMAQSIKAVGEEIAQGVAQATHGLAATSDRLAQRLGGVLDGFDHFNASMQAQMTSMQAIVISLDDAKNVLDESAGVWMRSAAPVMASIDASRQVATELGHVVNRVSSAQHEMAEMAKAVAQLTDKTSSVWENYRSRFEKVDDDLQAVFERLQDGTRAFGKEVMEFVGELDSSLAEGMNALSTGTEELRKVAEILVLDVKAKAA